MIVNFTWCERSSTHSFMSSCYQVHRFLYLYESVWIRCHFDPHSGTQKRTHTKTLLKRFSEISRFNFACFSTLPFFIRLRKIIRNKELVMWSGDSRAVLSLTYSTFFEILIKKLIQCLKRLLFLRHERKSNVAHNTAWYATKVNRNDFQSSTTFKIIYSVRFSFYDNCAVRFMHHGLMLDGVVGFVQKVRIKCSHGYPSNGHFITGYPFHHQIHVIKE